MRDVTPSTRSVIPEAVEAVTVSKDMVQNMCIEVANGGSPARWCVNNGLNFGQFMAVVKNTTEFQAQYKEAEESRKEWMKESILVMIQDMMAFDPAQAFTPQGNYKGMHDLPPEVTKMIKKSKTVKAKSDDDWDEIDSLEFFDKQKAIDQLGKYLQMFVDKKEVSHTLTLEETIARARKTSQN